MPKQLFVTLSVLVGLATAGIAAPAVAGAAEAYPDLKTQAPRDLRFAQVDFDEVVTDSPGSGVHTVLQFSNSVYNAGESALRVRGDIDTATRRGPAYQRIYDTEGNFVRERPAGDFYWHESHKHYHYEQWGIFQLWTKADYDEWLQTGEEGPEVQTGFKTTSCILDEEFWASLPGTRADPLYNLNGCYPPNGQDLMEGLSVGWSDTYDWYRPDQWIDLGSQHLSDGEYVLRSVSDPDNQIQESASGTVGGDPDRESRSSNAAIRRFKVQGGQIVDSDKPTGTVTLNKVDRTTESPAVTLRAIGRDDVSGPNRIRISNNGVTWSERSFTDWGSTPNEIPWNLSDPATGGNASYGVKTVYVQFRDVSGKWGDTVTDQIELTPSGTNTAYTNTVRADGAATHLRFDDSASASRPREEIARNDGYYIGTPVKAQPTLLGSAGEQFALRFDSNNDHVYVPSPSGLNATSAMTLEAWVRADTLPTGTQRTILAKPGRYALRTNGTNLEFWLGGMALPLSVSGLQAGQTYHVAATYDGSSTKLYINGQLKASGNFAGQIAAGGGDLYIGAYDDTANGRWLGTIDEPAVYPLALTPAKAQSHYDTGRVPLQRPAVPTNVTATPESSSRIRLRWTDNADNENAHVIERKLSTQDWADAESLATSQDEVSYLDLGLAPNTAYDYRIRARNSAGLSDWSTIASATTRQAPTAVTDAADPVAQTSATLKGRVNPRGTSTSYWFEYGTSTSYGSRAPATDASAGSGTTETARSQAISGLSAGTTYHYRVVAKSDETVVRGSDVTFTTLPNAPSAPTGLNATATSGTAINLSWTDVSGETSYVLERSTDSTFATGVTSTTPAQNATSASATGLTNDTTYYFRLKARNSGGDSAYTSAASARTHGVPVVTASHESVTRTTATLKGTVDPRGATATYRFDYGTSTAYGSSTTSKSAASSGPVSESITGLQPNTTYHYRLTANNSVGTREATGSFTTPPDPTPATPTGLDATASSGTAINVTWTDVSGETSYELQRSTSSTFTSPTTTTVAANATSASVTGLANDTTYYFRIRARNSGGGGDSAFSSSASARTHGAPVVTASHDNVTRNAATLNGTVDPRGATTTYRFDYGTTTAYGTSTTSKTASGAVSEPITGLQPNTTYHYRLVANNSVGTTQATGSFTTDPEPPPATPSGLNATAVSGTQINVSWSDVSSETGYVLERSTSSTFASGVTSETTAAGDTSESITGLANDTTYYFRVKARNVGGDSAYSSTASAKTHGAPAITATHDSVTRTTATLKGTVDPRGATTSYRFDYGTSTSYGSSTSQKNASSAGGVSEPISGLAPNTTYYYKLVAVNTIGTREATGSFTTSPDPTPSTPTGLTATAVSGTAIAVTWNDANGETSYQLQRSTSSDFSTDLTTTAPAADDTSAAATGLADNTTYFFRIRARNSNGGGDSGWSATDSATTHGAPVVTAAHDAVTRTTATLTGTVDPRGATTTYRFEYKADVETGWTSTTSKSAGNSRGAKSVSEALDGLQPNTPYDYKLVANNALGTTTSAGTFTTPAEPPPIAVTGDASEVTTTEATLSGTVDPEGFNALYRFEYGTTDAYGAVTSWTGAGDGTDPVPASAALTGLAPNTEYHYRLVVGGPGGTINGEDRTFTTTALPVPRPPDRPQQPPRDDEDPKPPVDQPDPPKQPDTDPPTTQTKVPTQTIARVLKRGLQLRFRADEDGRLTTRVYVSGRTLGLRGPKARRRVTVGKLTKNLVAGKTYTISVKLSKRARTAVRRRRSVRFTIESVMTDEAGNKTRKLRSSAVVHSRR